jgi:ferrous iron transport protein B
MTQRFDGWVGAFAYLLFVLLYIPCLSATATIYRETHLGWTLFIAGWTTGLAFLASTVFYQAATFALHPVHSLSWIGGLLLALALVIGGLYWVGRRKPSLPAAEAVAGGV